MIELDGYWFCFCGNSNFLSSSNFYPCKKDGRPIEPWVMDSAYWYCPRCGIVFEEKTLAIVGIRELENIPAQYHIIQQTLKRLEAERKRKKPVTAVS